ncbi:amidohydrolase family protein [Devosia albogilva]|uniref:Amidohydrolase family protein n=1 Tax=Devosia albogilva TaxID=429726 RepID=A0ABW5QLG9_9HYPH
MRILDTHLHLIYPDRFSYPWIGPGHPLNREWSHESYFAEAVGLGIESALHMEVDAAEADMEAETAFVLELPRIAGAIAACRPERAGFVAHMERLSAEPRVKGVRRILHEVPDELSEQPIFAENLRRLTDYDLSFDLCLRADQLRPIGLRLVDAAPDVQFILDHCGNPDIAKDGLEPWRADTAALAERPNVAVKISGIATNARPGWQPHDLRPYVEHLIHVFGWDRVVWGSDHPVLTRNGSLTRWVQATREIVGSARADEQARLFRRNAERIYRVG